ncbi:MAG: DUF6377 domain-containing protein [Candidatus Cryptobacteroides sp.]
MRKIFLYMLTLAVFLPMSVQVEASPEGDALHFPVIRDLDRVIKESDRYQREKEARIGSLKDRLAKATDRDSMYWACASLFNEYAFYQIDSALSYSFSMLGLSEDSDDKYIRCLPKLNIAEEYIQVGQYVQAKEVLESIRRDEVPDALLESYYYKFNALYEALSDYSLDLDQKHRYRTLEYMYKDSVYMVSPDNIYIKSSLLDAEGQTGKALQILLDAYSGIGPDDRAIGPVAYAISLYYRKTGMRTEEKKWLIASAISDIKCSVKEYISLRRLAEILYEEGDVDRAHRYIWKCLSDAEFCNARLREIQVAQIFPLFEAAYQRKLKSQVILLSCAIAVILVLLTVCYHFLRMKNQKQKELDNANRKLQEAGAIKNGFISNLLLECVNRIDSLDDYRRRLNKMALSGDKAGVFSELRSVSFVEGQRMDFYSTFDSIFLQIVPDFISGVNSLMKPGNHFSCDGGTMTMELRILALIRLGISETDRIASILKCSKATVYSYRSRIRLKSEDPDNFEKNLMKIRTI